MELLYTLIISTSRRLKQENNLHAHHPKLFRHLKTENLIT